MELDIRTYILLGGGLLIGLVLLHGFWIAKRARRPLPALQGTGRAGQGSEQMPLDVDSALLPEGDEASQAPMQRMEPTLRGGEQGTFRGAQREERRESAADAPADQSRPRGRRIEIAGKRTEPTVPRTARLRPRAASSHQRGLAAPAGECGLPASEPSRHDDALYEDDVADDGPADEVLVLWVVAKSGAVLSGTALVKAFSEAGLEYDGQVFQKIGATGREMFAVANGVEPGTFDLSDVETFATRGVVFLLRLAVAEDGAEAFDAMLEAAQTLAADAEAELKDEQRSDVSGQTVMHYRQRIADFKRKSMRR